MRRTIEVEVEVVCSVTPGEPEQGRTYACGGVPASGPEVEIIEATTETGGIDVRRLLTDEDRRAIEEDATEQAQEAADEGEDPDDANDRRRDDEYDARSER